jgi:hypothetical protein
MTIRVLREALPFACLALAIGCGRSSIEQPQADPNVVETIRTSLSDGATEVTEQQVVAEPTGFATLRGTFRFDGQPPALNALSITKDESVCAPGGKTVYDNDFLVNSANQGLANVLVYADQVPAEWVHPDAQPGNSDEIEFDQKACVFLTRMVAMQTSQTLLALNSDPVGHNLMVAEFNQTIPSGGSARYQPRREQRSAVEMRCAVHPWMKAWFINRDNGYFAVTDENGAFEIPNLPAGVDVEFRVWQERIGPVTAVTLNGQTAKWAKGKMKVLMEPDTEMEMDVVLSESVLP